MGLMFTTVIGYAIMLGIAGLFTMHYLRKGLDSSDAERVDPKPEVK
jgi:hypothetical protein